MYKIGIIVENLSKYMTRYDNFYFNNIFKMKELS